MPLGRLCAVAIGAVISIAAARPLFADADLAVTMTGPSSALAGAELPYVITVTNKGPSRAYDVDISDDPPSGTVLSSVDGGSFSCYTFFGLSSCSIGTLESGQMAQVTITLRALSNVDNGATITNTTIVSLNSAYSQDPDTTNNRASVTTTLRESADLSVVNTGPDGGLAGKTLTYAIRVQEDGITARDVIFTDVVPDGATFVSITQPSDPNFKVFACTTPAPGDVGTITCSVSRLDIYRAQFQIVLRVNDNVPIGTTITNAVSVSSSTPDPNVANNSQSVTTVIGKTLADLGVSRMQPDTAIAGKTFTYTFNTANGGPDAAQSVVLIQELPPLTTFVSLSQSSGPAFACTHPTVGETGTINCSIATLAAGATATFTVMAFLPANIPDDTQYDSPQLKAIVSVASATLEAFKANNVVDWYLAFERVSDLAVTVAGPPTVKAGSDLTMTAVVTNKGPSYPGITSLYLNPGSGFEASVLSGGGCQYGLTGSVNCVLFPLPVVGGSVTVIIAYHTKPEGVTGTTVHFSAGAGPYLQVLHPYHDPNLDDNYASVSAIVTNGFVNLALKNTPSADPRAGGAMSYTLVVSNAGPSPAEDVVVKDNLPFGTSLLSVSTTNGSCGDPYPRGSTAVTC